MRLQEIERVKDEGMRALNSLFSSTGKGQELGATALHLNHQKVQILFQIVYPLFALLHPDKAPLSLRLRWWSNKKQRERRPAAPERAGAKVILLFNSAEKDTEQMIVEVKYCCDSFQQALVINGRDGKDQRIFADADLPHHVHR